MRLRVVLAGLGVLAASSGLFVGLVLLRAPATDPFHRAASEEAPPISASGPYPRAVLDQAEFDFGRMESGELGQHVFTIRNDGEAPLMIGKGATTCHCTVSELASRELAVGAAAQITLRWKPSGESQHFGHSASILTNDPENPVMQLKILGKVVPRLMTIPGQFWEAPEFAVDEPTALTGMVISPVAEQFRILSLTCASPDVTAECLPIAPQELEDYDGKSGYQIRVSISPRLPVGAFRFPLTIKTDLPERNAEGQLGAAISLDVIVAGRRRGPLRIVGRQWDEDQMAIAMGAFSAADGRKLKLMVFVQGVPAEGLQLTERRSVIPPN